MSNKKQTSKNLDLTNKLFDYLLKSNALLHFPKNASVVPFSKNNKKLNKENETLIENLKEEGRPIIIAREPKTKSASWKLTPLSY